MTLDEAKARTEARGFRFLSETYDGNGKKHRFACPQGHEWAGRPSNMWHGSGCPHCYGNTPMTLEETIERTAAIGFRFLSPAYKNNHSKHLFGCPQGHEWNAIPKDVWRGHGCPTCSRHSSSSKRRSSTEEARRRTRERGFSFLSKTYLGDAKKHLFGCGGGHEWKASFRNIMNGSGCPHCAGKAPLTLEQAKERTEARGFRWISESFEGVAKKHSFGCPQGHEWEAVAGSVWVGNGCPHCASLKSERLVREILAEDFGVPTEKARPAWLRHLKGKPLELDGLQGDFGFAWEHQGDQHFAFNPHFHRGGEKDFQAQQERDAFKREATALQGILLFEIPQTERATREKVKKTIEREGERLCLPFTFNPQFREMMAQAGL